MILHIDCNAFFASCEVSLRPELRGKPVVVANYNEAGGGVILALTKEAKALGLRRGNPVFQVKQLLEDRQVTMLPVNHARYREISRRLMVLVREQGIVLDVHQYSVDEFFGSLPVDEVSELRMYINKVKLAIEEGLGIPVSCGASVTYTLAMVATWYAKRHDGYGGICVLPRDKVEVALKGLPVQEVWGVGHQTIRKMHKLGIKTAWDYAQKGREFIQRQFHLPGMHTWLELNGTPCIALLAPPQRRSIMHSRTFVRMTDSQEKLHTYISNFAVGAACKLREHHALCRSVTVFIRTNRHREDLSQYDGQATERLETATADTVTIVKAAVRALARVFKPYYLYKQAGVVLADIVSDEAQEQDIFAPQSEDPSRQRRLMQATDAINTRFGMNMIRLACQGTDSPKEKE